MKMDKWSVPWMAAFMAAIWSPAYNLQFAVSGFLFVLFHLVQDTYLANLEETKKHI